MPAKKILFIDRDGTLIKEPKNYELDSFKDLIFYPFMFQYMGRIAMELDYELVMVSNQDGLGSPSFPEKNFYVVHNFIMQCLQNEGIIFSNVCIDKTFPWQNAPTRKPGIGMLKQYLNNSEYDIANSFVIGDRITDVQLAKNLGCKALWLNNNSGLGMKEVTDSMEVLKNNVVLESEHWKDVYEYLIS